MAVDRGHTILRGPGVGFPASANTRSKHFHELPLDATPTGFLLVAHLRPFVHHPALYACVIVWTVTAFVALLCQRRRRVQMAGLGMERLSLAGTMTVCGLASRMGEHGWTYIRA